MTRYLMLIGIIVNIFVITLLIYNISNKKTKYIILVGPFVLAGILYLSIFLLTKDISPYECDGAPLFGIFVSFMLFGMGILLNITNILHLAFANKRRKI